MKVNWPKSRLRRTFRSFCFCLHCFILWLMKTTPSRNFFYKNCYVPSRKNVQQKYFFEVCVKLIFYSAWPNIKILNCLAANGSLFYHCILFTRKLFFAHLTSFKHSDNRDTKTKVTKAKVNQVIIMKKETFRQYLYFKTKNSHNFPHPHPNHNIIL